MPEPAPSLKFACPACGKHYSLLPGDLAAAGGVARPRCGRCRAKLSVRQGDLGLTVTLEEAPTSAPPGAAGPPAAEPPEAEPPEEAPAGPVAGERLGRYELEALVGRGGMGSVYRAFDPATHRQVALKVLPPGTSAQDVARFEREVQVQGNVNHPHILPIFDSGQAGVYRYYTMELLREPLALSQLGPLVRTGEALRSARLKPVSTLSGLVERVLLPLCDAVHHANLKEGVLHRDLTPGNVLVDLHGLRPYLIDFGVCTLLERKNPRLADLPSEASLAAQGATRTVSGTLVYMPPEQIQGQADRRGDVWGLGALLHFLVAGGPPVEPAAHSLVPRTNRIEGLEILIEQAQRDGDAGEVQQYRAKLAELEEGRERTLAEVQQDVARGRYQPRPASVDPALEAVIVKAMAPDAEQRYRNARELKADLEAWIAGRAPSALAEQKGGAVRALYASRQTLRRWRWPLVALVLLGAGAVVWTLFSRARAQDEIAIATGRVQSFQARGPGPGQEDLIWRLLELDPQSQVGRDALRRLYDERASEAARGRVSQRAVRLAQTAREADARGEAAAAASLDARAALRQMLDEGLLPDSPALAAVARDERRVIVAPVAGSATLTFQRVEADGSLGGARAAEAGENRLPPGRYVLAVASDGRRVHAPFEIPRSLERVEVEAPIDPARLPARTIYVQGGRPQGPLGEGPVGALVWEATEVTVERYAAWLATLPQAEQARRVAREAGLFGAIGRPLWERKDGRFVPAKADLQKPIDSISLHDARAFALAEGRRLPTAQEWAWAATGPFGAPCALGALERLFSDVACLGPEARVPREVGTSAGDVSLFGLQDLAGNVAELTSTLSTRSGETGWLVLGSGYGLAPERGRAASAVVVPGWMPLRGVGFRLVMDPP